MPLVHFDLSGDPGSLPASHTAATTDAGVNGYHRGKCALAAVSAPGQFAPPDTLYLAVRDCIEADGRTMPPSVRLRTMLREVQKAIERHS